ACAVGRAVLTLLADEGPDGILARARRLGDVLHTRLAGLVGHGVLAVRGMGLWAGVDIEPRLGTGRAVSEAMMRRGVLVKDTHGSSVRLSPPLVITEAELHAAVDALEGALADLA
ncbi:MAG: ornithine--oxo-acid transaminase, partial [Pseudonocardiales bacterium]|nr:ornithine--oxo-acid transaminase [Pseudonocardiales bacterium]